MFSIFFADFSANSIKGVCVIELHRRKDPTVFIIDDDLEMRNSLSWLIEAVQLNVEVFEDASCFLNNYDADRTGCILLDIRMPGMSGLELLDILNKLNNRLPVIVITGHGDIPMVIRAMKAGAMDFILKPFNDQQLIEQIQKAIVKNSADEYTLRKSIVNASNSSKSLADETIRHNYALLTRREREIMNLVVEGKLNKQIAYELNMAISTAELHRSRMMKKMQAKSIAQLVKMMVCLDLQ